MNEIRFSSNRFAKVSSAMLPSGVNALCAIANENIFGKTFAPRCSKGILNDQSALLPPPIEGDADKFYNKGNSAAGTRVRKGMQDLKNIAQAIRAEVQELKNKEA